MVKPANIKGQLISKCLFGVFNFFQNTNGNKFVFVMRYHSNKVEFVRSVFGRNVGLKNSYQLCLIFKNKLQRNSINKILGFWSSIRIFDEIIYIVNEYKCRLAVHLKYESFTG